MHDARRPRVVHILEDRSLGGVRAFLEAQTSSPLAREFELLLASPRQAIQALAPSPSLAVLHDASSWARLPRLWRLSRRAPTVLVEHHYCRGFEERALPRHKRAQFLAMLRLSYSLADRVVAVSRAQASWIARRRLAPAEKVRVIRPISKLASETFVDEPRRRGEGPLILGAYGRFCPQKGFETLIEALARIPAAEIRLLLGGFGPLAEELRALAAADPRIELVGRVDDPALFLAGCDVVVVPSRWEPYGLVALEARAAGRALVVSDADGLPEQAEGCGQVFPAGDAAALARILEGLTLEDQRHWQEAARSTALWDVREFQSRWWFLLGEMLDPMGLNRPPGTAQLTPFLHPTAR